MEEQQTWRKHNLKKHAEDSPSHPAKAILDQPASGQFASDHRAQLRIASPGPD